MSQGALKAELCKENGKVFSGNNIDNYDGVHEKL